MTRPHTKYDPPDSPTSVGWTQPHTLRLVEPGEAYALELGGTLAPVDVEYETYGTLAPSRDNVVLMAHALSGDAHVAGWAKHPPAGRPHWADRPGWWDAMVGPGKPVDTRRFFVICANVLGGCYGTTGPSSVDPATGRPYGQRFPLVTVGDWVRLQARLLDRLGVDTLHAVVGGSLGGQQALEWALAFPGRVRRCVVLAAAARLSAQGLGFNAVGRASIVGDPRFAGGDYYGGEPPVAGLAAARMLAHLTYLSERSMHLKFGRRRREAPRPAGATGVEFEVESYLDHQGRQFVKRFDANSYIYITRAMDYYDAAARWGGGDLVETCRRIRSRMLVTSFATDWLYPPDNVRELALALCRAGRPATYVEVPSAVGHDAFLVETRAVGRLLESFLDANGEGARP